MCISDEKTTDRTTESVWQREDARCGVVLHEVFQWLSGCEVSFAGYVCAAWRRAAAEPALWRRLLRRDAGIELKPRTTRALAATGVCWRDEYVRTFARWDKSEMVRCAGVATHAALDPVGSTAGGRLAVLTDDDVTLTIWRYPSFPSCEWISLWSCSLRRYGWTSAGRVQWAARGGRLLLAGQLALSTAWELIVVQLDEYGLGRVCSRSRCSAGAAGCWADAEGSTFLALELAVFGIAPRVAATTVWINSAEQETQSEHAGVRAPVFRIYNDSGEQFTQVLVVESPTLDAASTQTAADASSDLVFYLNATKKMPNDEVKMRVMVTTSGCRAECGGAAYAWGMPAARPPAVLAAAGGDLRERAARRARAPSPAPASEPPTEREVRALCTPPDDTCALPAVPVGLTPHPSGRCVWLTLSSGEAWCLSLPTLRLLRRLGSTTPHTDLTFTNNLLYYVQPSVSENFFASPTVSRGGGVAVWSAASGAAAPRAQLPPLPAPPVQALLLPADDTMLVFIADTIHKLRPASVLGVCSRDLNLSCDGPETRATDSCPPKPRPPCRPPPPHDSRKGIRIACCPPPRGCRPPCPETTSKFTLTCDTKQNDPVYHVEDGHRLNSGDRDPCGASQDRVALRLALAEAARRAEYLREVSEFLACRADPACRATITCGPLGGTAGHCVRATDGSDYTVACPPEPLGECGPGREPPPPQMIDLQPSDACQVTPRRYVDPCAHRPKKFIEIVRVKTECATPTGAQHNCAVGHGKGPCAHPPKKKTESENCGRGIASRIIEGLTSSSGRKCGSQGHGTSAGRRGLHTSTLTSGCFAKGAGVEGFPGGIDEVLRDRAAFKEAGRGRVAGYVGGGAKSRSAQPGARLELPVSPCTGRVSVHVMLHELPPACAASPACDVPLHPRSSPLLRYLYTGLTTTCNSKRQDSLFASKLIQEKISSKRMESTNRRRE